MYKSIFPGYHEESKIWIYGFSRPVNNHESEIIKQYLDTFIQNWKSHGDKVQGACEFLHNRFVIIAAHIPGVSGCSIDSSVDVFKQLKDTYNLDALNLHNVYYRNNEGIQSVARNEFNNLIQAGEITMETIVFDTSLQTVG